MKKNELKSLIKPLVKECNQEVLIEEGLLSNIVSEVAKGMQGNLVVESRPNIQREPERIQMKRQAEQTKAKLTEHRRKLMDAIGKDAYGGVDLFENTEPMTSYEAAAPKAGAVDLGDPTDSGVDISSLMGGASKIWKAMQ